MFDRSGFYFYHSMLQHSTEIRTFARIYFCTIATESLTFHSIILQRFNMQHYEPQKKAKKRSLLRLPQHKMCRNDEIRNKFIDFVYTVNTLIRAKWVQIRVMNVKTARHAPMWNKRVLREHSINFNVLMICEHCRFFGQMCLALWSVTPTWADRGVNSLY